MRESSRPKSGIAIVATSLTNVSYKPTGSTSIENVSVMKIQQMISRISSVLYQNLFRKVQSHRHILIFLHRNSSDVNIIRDIYTGYNKYLNIF